jgi:hypothetical protein
MALELYPELENIGYSRETRETLENALIQALEL